jgi:hypothetical protein
MTQKVKNSGFIAMIVIVSVVTVVGIGLYALQQFKDYDIEIGQLKYEVSRYESENGLLREVIFRKNRELMTEKLKNAEITTLKVDQVDRHVGSIEEEDMDRFFRLLKEKEVKQVVVEEEYNFSMYWFFVEEGNVTIGHYYTIRLMGRLFK